MSCILILHASVGTGHKTAAQALAKAFQQRGVEQVTVEDTLDHGSTLFRELYSRSYLELSEKAPILWAYWYENSDEDETKLTRDLRLFVSRLGVNKLDEVVQRCQPEAIVCTHFLPVDLFARARRKGKLSIPVYCVVTDYTGHVFWVHPEIDGYFVGTDATRKMLAQRGVPESLITVTGIPVDPEIATPKDRGEMRARHRLQDGPVITLMGSGLKTETVRQIVTGLLEQNLTGTLVVVAGRSKELQTELSDIASTGHLQVRVLGFIDYLDDLVAASDLVITKAGGLIVSEVMARHTPMVVVDPIRGQEEWNADYVVSVGAGVQVRLPRMVPVVVQHLITNPARLAMLRAGATQAGRPGAAFAIADQVLAAARQPATARPDVSVNHTTLFGNIKSG